MQPNFAESIMIVIAEYSTYCLGVKQIVPIALHIDVEVQ